MNNLSLIGCVKGDFKMYDGEILKDEVFFSIEHKDDFCEDYEEEFEDANEFEADCRGGIEIAGY